MSHPLNSIDLSAKMLVCSSAVSRLLKRIDILEADSQISKEDKLDKIKKIREEITKVSVEIDNIKKEIKLAHVININ